MIEHHEITYDPALRMPYEERLRAAAAALAKTSRDYFALMCKPPETVRELTAIEDLLSEPPGGSP
jgi:hypothetical protein